MSPTATAPTSGDRIRGAIWGSLVGDAACLGAHWIYQVREIARLWPDGLRGFEEPTGGVWPHSTERTNVPAGNHPTAHYHAGKRSGDQTHYGHAALLQLASVAALGRFDEVDFGQRFVDTFGSPQYEGYTDQAMRGMLANHATFQSEHPAVPFDFQHGADDFEGSTYSRLAAVVVAHRDDPAFLSVIERATRVTQNNSRAVAHAQCHALLLRSLLRGHGSGLAAATAEAEAALLAHVDGDEGAGDDIPGARLRQSAELVPAAESFGQACRLDHSFPVGWPATMIARPQPSGPMCLHATCSAEVEVRPIAGAALRADVLAELRGARSRAAEDVVPAVAALGQGCRLDQSFPSALQAAYRHEHDFREAILDTARAGGDSAGRASLVGAWLGALLGVHAVPIEWRERLTAHREIARYVEVLVGHFPAT